MTKKRIFGLDIMRATAVLLVLLSRLKRIIPDSKLSHFVNAGGIIGVEIFFVLSGFLIGTIVLNLYLKDDYSFSVVKNFWIRRFFRILPNYFLILLLNIFVFKFLGLMLPEETWKYFFFIHNFSGSLPPFFMESWSLSVEEFSYVILPISLFLITFLKVKTSKLKLFKYTAITMILFFMGTKIMYHFNNHNNLSFWALNLRTISIYRIDSIFYGVLAAYFSFTHSKNWYKYANYLLFLGLFIVISLHATIFIKKSFFTTNMFFWNVLYFPINSLAIACTVPFLSKIKSAPKLILKPITFISIISYAIYLLHNLVMYLFKIYYPIDGLTNLQLFMYFVVYCSTTISISFLLYRYYEKPMTDLRDKPMFSNT